MVWMGGGRGELVVWGGGELVVDGDAAHFCIVVGLDVEIVLMFVECGFWSTMGENKELGNKYQKKVGGGRERY